MSKPLNRRAASTAFAKGETHIRTCSALTFEGDIAYSYAEPIAFRKGRTLYVTTGKFSMTTSHHRGQVAGAFAVEYHVVDYNADRTIGKGNRGRRIVNVDHGKLRQMVREAGGSLGPWGRVYDKAA